MDPRNESYQESNTNGEYELGNRSVPSPESAHSLLLLLLLVNGKS